MTHKDMQDRVVIYFSKDDECYVAHSLRTDQVGTGDGIVAALADLIRGINNLWNICQEDKTISLYRDAPESVRKMADRSDKLPMEIYEQAHKVATGEFPDDWELKAQPKKRTKKSRVFDGQILDMAGCE